MIKLSYHLIQHEKGNASIRNLAIFQRGEAPLATGKAIVPSGTAKGTEAEEAERERERERVQHSSFNGVMYGMGWDGMGAGEAWNGAECKTVFERHSFRLDRCKCKK